jgi:hypothetical protein
MSKDHGVAMSKPGSPTKGASGMPRGSEGGGRGPATGKAPPVGKGQQMPKGK